MYSSELRAELRPDNLPDVSEVAQFDSTKLRHVETKESNVLPTKDGNEHWKSCYNINTKFCGWVTRRKNFIIWEIFVGFFIWHRLPLWAGKNPGLIAHWASKFCSWFSGNSGLVVTLASEITAVEIWRFSVRSYFKISDWTMSDTVSWKHEEI